MAEGVSLKAKVCTVGEIAVGKTSLVRRFAFGDFDEFYSTTLGIHLSKKTIDLPEAPESAAGRVEVLLFDVMGQRKLRDLLVDSYFRGAQGLIAVWDVTRPESLRELPAWIDMAREVAGDIPVVFATNKADLSADRTADESAVQEIAERYGGATYTTSAKTGENVDLPFRQIAAEIARRSSAPPPPPEETAATALEDRARKIVGPPTRDR